jgi:hypothetical protein
MRFKGHAMTKTNKAVTYTVGLLLLLGAIAYCVFQFQKASSGYCFKEQRYLTDEELIHAAIRYSSYKMTIDSSEAAIRSFYENNPTCCSVDRESNMASSWFENLLGFYYAVVEVNFEVKPEIAERSGNRFYKEYVQISSCGGRGAMYGEGIDSLER